LGAAWTLGSLAHLAANGARSVTYFETTGWRGVMELESGAAQPELFPSLPGGVFPLYHVLADVGEYAVAEVLLVDVSDPLKAQGLALRGERLRVLAANVTPDPQPVMIVGLLPQVLVRRLDETNAEEAMRSPETWRAQTGERCQTDSGRLVLELGPYAVARIDSA
jgi:hypothetical protein